VDLNQLTVKTLLIGAACMSFQGSSHAINCATGSVKTQIENDLLLYATIDVNQMGNTSSSCNGVQEYSVGVRNISNPSQEYTVYIEGYYMCSTTASDPNACTSEAGDAIHGDGWNGGVLEETEIDSGECLMLEFLNGDGNPPLPDCCDDDSAAALTWMALIVTKVGNQTCSPVYSSLIAQGRRVGTDGRCRPGFSANQIIDPAVSSIRAGSFCPSDGDLDGFPNSCTCGNSTIQGGSSELCDGTNLNGASCSSLGYGSGTLWCDGDCRDYSLLACSSPPSSEDQNSDCLNDLP
jgi:hypothetical protein